MLDKFSRSFALSVVRLRYLPAPPSLDRIVSIRRKADEGVSLSFDTVDNEHIRIGYSEDLEHWKAATVQADGTGSEVIYEDDGPPKTDRHPKETRQRYYRLIFGQ